MNRYIEAFLTLVLAVLLLASCGGNAGGNITASSGKSITAYSFTSPPVVGIIDENAKTISMIVPPGTNITALVATFATTGARVKVGATGQVSNATPNDFTNPVLYVVTAADGSTATYTVTVTIDPKAISTFSFTTPDATGKIDASTKEILVYVPSGTDLTSLVATFSSTGQSLMVGNTIQVSGVTPNNFTSPVTYTVTAADGTTRDYIVTVVPGAFAAQWARSVTAGNDTSNFNSVAVASDGSVYAAGYIYAASTYDFGNGVTATGPYTAPPATPSTDSVLVKYNSSGAAQWARTVTAWNRSSLNSVCLASGSSFNSVSVASDGSIYAAGFIRGIGTFDFGNNVTAQGTSCGENIVLVKYNSSGTALWAQTVTAGNDASSFYSVAAASDGSVYASGYIYSASTHTFGPGVAATGTFSGSNAFNIVLVKYNSAGVAQWAQTPTGGNNIASFNGLAVASDGSVYASGYVTGTGIYDFGNGVTAAGLSTSANIILVKYAGTGTAEWARTMTTGSGYSAFTSVAAASDGSLYAAGYIGGTSTYNFGNGVSTASPTSGYSIVLVKYNSIGEPQWAQTVAAAHFCTDFRSVSVAPDGFVYAAGYMHEFGLQTGVYDFGNGVTAASTSTDPLGDTLLIVKYSSSGVAQRARAAIVGPYDSRSNGVFVASDGSVYAAGYISGSDMFDFGDDVTAAGAYSNYFNALLLKYY